MQEAEKPNLARARRHVVGFAALLEGKDATTADHCERVRDLCVRLATEVGLGTDRVRDLELGAMLHDIGKCKIPDAILNKAGPLDENEWKVMRRHPEIGAEIVSKIDFLRGAADVVRNHHEKYDGSGYPRGLKAEDIPLAARIFMSWTRTTRSPASAPTRTPRPESALAEIVAARTHRPAVVRPERAPAAPTRSPPCPPP